MIISVNGYNTNVGPWVLNITEYPTGGPCCLQHANAACDDQTCTDTICALNPSCCDPEVGWSQACADLADDSCEQCTTPEESS